MKQYLLLLTLLTAPLYAQDLPAGTHSAEEPSQADALNARITAAESDLDKQDYAAAATKLKAAIAAGAHDTRAYYDLGFAEERNGDDTAAADSYTRAIAANPKVGQPRLALGLLEARDNQLDKAHADLLAAAKLPDESPVLRGRALRALARIDATSDPDTAREELIAAIQLTEETPEDTLMTADLAEQAGDDADAEAAYRRALDKTPTNIDAIAGLSHVLVKEKKIADAEALLSAALKSNPDDPRLVSQLAVLYAAEEKADQAIPLIEKLRASRPALAADPQLSAMLAHLYSINNDYAKAEALDRASLTKAPDDPELLDDLGTALVKQQKYAEAEAVLTKAFSLRDHFSSQQDWGTVAEHLAFAASKNNHPETTLEAIRQRDTVLPSSGSSLWLTAISYDALHQHKQAAEAYKAFLAEDKGQLSNEEFEARHRLVALANMK